MSDKKTNYQLWQEANFILARDRRRRKKRAERKTMEYKAAQKQRRIDSAERQQVVSQVIASRVAVLNLRATMGIADDVEK